MKFNVNHYVKVKLTEAGTAELERQHNELCHLGPLLGDYKPQPVDSDGYSRFQMHDLMNRFGHMMLGSMVVPFETEIIIEPRSISDGSDFITKTVDIPKEHEEAFNNYVKGLMG